MSDAARLAMAERELDELRTTIRIMESVTAADITVQTGAVILADIDGTTALLMRNRLGEWQTCPGHGESRKYRSTDIGKVRSVYRLHIDKGAPSVPEGREADQPAPALDLSLVNRVEVIDRTGRAFSKRYAVEGVTLDVQDDGRTVKLFPRELEF